MDGGAWAALSRWHARHFGCPPPSAAPPLGVELPLIAAESGPKPQPQPQPTEWQDITALLHAGDVGDEVPGHDGVIGLELTEEWTARFAATLKRRSTRTWVACAAARGLPL